MLSAHYVGGEYTCRDHRDDPQGRPPMKPIDVAKQRDALHLLQDEILSAKAFQFKPELLRYLAPTQWHDSDSMLWYFFRSDYEFPVLQRVLSIQRIVLSHLLDSRTLRSLQEFSLQADPGQESLQMSEVFDALTTSIWTELPNSDADLKNPQKFAFSPIRRNLQREHVSRLARLVLGPKPTPWMDFLIFIFFDESRPAPADARSLARLHLRQIDARIQRVLARKAPTVQVDAQTQAHLEEIHDQIEKVFKALLQANET